MNYAPKHQRKPWSGFPSSGLAGQPIHGLQRPPESSQRPRGEAYPRPNIVLSALFAVFFLFNFPAFTIQLANDPLTGQFVGSPVLAIMTSCGEVFVSVVIISSKDCQKILKRVWPIHVMIALMLASTLWSLNPSATVQVSFRVAATLLLGVAIVGYMPGLQSIKFITRTMVLGCVLSIIWVFAYPETSVHQSTDPLQSVHAGLWRGIFSHKQGLGLFSGFVLGLLFVYRTRVFPAVLLIPAAAAGAACLLGSASATGLILPFLITSLFAVGGWISSASPGSRKNYLIISAGVSGILLVGFHFGAFDFVITNVLGKSTDLTGRADFWPITIDHFNNSGRSILGGGIGANFASVLSEWSIDNGYLDMLIYFGYLGTGLLFYVFGCIFARSLKALQSGTLEQVLLAAFPFGIFTAILIANVTESNFLNKHFCTVLTAVAISILFDERTGVFQTVSKNENGRARSRLLQK
jgi:exopolysaccharide production protein ExoQ